ncbi:hypothetical protein [Saccharothrix deserti]|uniref:hypothetical protein n=1 Tax=Saccharothrix deserti TaxID=2593674 RepID=UPI00131DF3CA|nr:hypothetical protein [Saccharothrix deserti]
MITQINLQLPILTDDSSPLPTTIVKEGVFGGRATSNTKIYLLPESSAFSKTRAVTAHVTGSGGSVQTPARLLSGIGASLNTLSSDAVEAFQKDALPRLSMLTQSRTTITVGSFYDLTILVRSSTSLTFIYTPIGTTPPSEAETLGL